MTAGVMTMGRPKKSAKPTAPAPKEGGERETVIHMKGSAEYVAWLDRVHRETHIPKVQIFRLALAEWAQKRGIPTPPEI
jgi:hypothetical protein